MSEQSKPTAPDDVAVALAEVEAEVRARLAFPPVGRRG